MTDERSAAVPTVDPKASLVFIVNASSGSSAPEDTRAAIEAALAEAGRTGELRFTRPADLAQAAHAHGCAMGLVPQGTFNCSPALTCPA